MIAELGKTRLDYEITEAVNGRALDLTDTRLFSPAVDSEFTPGAFGCVFSHLAIYRRVADDGHEIALVLEDDVILPADLDELLDVIAPQMKGAEVVLLNFSSYFAKFTKEGAVPIGSSRLLVHIVDDGSPWSGAAYLITREACARMAETALPVRARADAWAHFYREGALDRVRCVMPMPVANSVTLRSTKDNFRPGSIQARVLETVANAKIPLLYQVLALRRQRHLQHYRNGQVEFVEALPGSEPPPLLTRIP